MKKANLARRRNAITRTFALSIGLVSACGLPTAEDAEIGCGIDAAVSVACPGRVTPDAGSLDANADGD